MSCPHKSLAIAASVLISAADFPIVSQLNSHPISTECSPSRALSGSATFRGAGNQSDVMFSRRIADVSGLEILAILLGDVTLYSGVSRCGISHTIMLPGRSCDKMGLVHKMGVISCPYRC